MNARLLISIVTFNSGRSLSSCLESLKRQTFRDFRVCLWDNASTDETPSIIDAHRDVLTSAHFSKSNLGFCSAHNRVISSTRSEYVLVLNPDVVLETRFLEILMRAMEEDSGAGSATGKLLRWPPETDNPEAFYSRQGASARVLDSAGIYITPNQRHFDRGSGESDAGQYDRREYVFGATGAAAFYRRAMLQEIQEGKEYFDESFFAYREDADLAWRAQWMGWRCLYVPEARGYHERKVLPERRPALPRIVNMHSFKNRFLLRIKNMDPGTYARFFLPITLRDIGILGYVLIREWSSLPGIPLILRAIPRSWARRKSLFHRRRVAPAEMRSWFSCRPVAKSIGNSERAGSRG